MIGESKFFLIPTSGINVSVNDFMHKDGELLMARNVYSPRFGVKALRPGYTLFLDNPDNQPVVNLIYFNFPNGQKGILRISGGKIYRNSFSGSSWGTPILTLTTNSSLFSKRVANTIMLSKLHLSSQAIGFYKVFDGTSFTDFTSDNTPYADYLTNWRGRIFAGVYTINHSGTPITYYSRLKFSSVDFAGSDPWLEDELDPSSSGSLSVNAGNDGIITGLSIVSDRVTIYKEGGVYKFNGVGVIRLPYKIGSYPYTQASTGTRDYFFSPQGVFFNSGGQVELASFPVGRIIDETFQKIGVNLSKIIAGSWKDFYFLYLDKIYWRGKTYNYAMLVYNQRFDEWYLWTLSHQMTCFSTYIDPNTGEEVLISGDVSGNAYVWGESYSSDDGKDIDYEIQSSHLYFNDITLNKRVSRYYFLGNVGSQSQLMFEFDKENNPIQVEVVNEKFKEKSIVSKYNKDFKTLSIHIKGSAKDTRPYIEAVGLKVSYKGERYG